ncbi:MAG TPA: amidohydrolase family protein [Acidimicrobiales bacterium]|nr:amidohydrolase family protein [Acidimicrobiales bacterium]
MEIEDGRIRSIGPAPASPPDRIIAPGFVDLQVNGHEDIDVAHAATRADWERLDQLLVAQGVVAWCPTLVTAPLEAYRAPLEHIARAAARGGTRPAVLGAHLEGPFLGRRPGAHDPRYLLPIDMDWLENLPPVVRLVTLGPELEGAKQAVAMLSGRGIVVSLGHSDADLAQSAGAADAGATLVTHLFNAMGAFEHRRPGLIGLALTDPRLVPTIICDGVHVHPVAVLAAFSARAGRSGRAGHPGIALVTDAVAWRSGAVGGLGLVRHGTDAPRRPDGTIAGSALTMDRAVANAVAFGVEPAAALTAASGVPAGVMGLADRGHLSTGSRADLVVLSPDLELQATWIGGREVWAA